MSQKFTAQIAVSNVDDEQLGQIISMLATMEHLGHLGSGRFIKFYADGDGAFHPRISVEGLSKQNIETCREKYGKWNDDQEFVIITD